MGISWNPENQVVLQKEQYEDLMSLLRQILNELQDLNQACNEPN